MNTKNQKSQKLVDKIFKDKNDILPNTIMKKIMNVPQKNINVNIINSFKIVNEQYKRKNSYENENLNNKEAKTNETNEINFLNLMDGKPLNTNKKRPTMRINFEDES